MNNHGITAVAPTEFFDYRGVRLAGINQWVALIHQLKISILCSHFSLFFLSMLLFPFAKFVSGFALNESIALHI